MEKAHKIRSGLRWRILLNCRWNTWRDGKKRIFQRHTGPLDTRDVTNLAVCNLGLGINCITMYLKLFSYSISPEKYQSTPTRTFTLTTNTSLPHTITVTVKQTISRLKCHAIWKVSSKAAWKTNASNIYFPKRGKKKPL